MEVSPSIADAGSSPEERLARIEKALEFDARIDAVQKQLQALQLQHGPSELQWEKSRWKWLLVGFGVLGGSIGYIAGLSTAKGVSNTLLTGMMTFVGGSLLSYTGFRWRRGVDPPTLDPSRVGSSILGFALMTALGASLGVYARSHSWLGAKPQAVQAVKKTQSSKDPQNPRHARASLLAKLTARVAELESGDKGGDMRGRCQAPDAAELRDLATSWRSEDPLTSRKRCREFFARLAPQLATCGLAHIKVDQSESSRRDALLLADLASLLAPLGEHVSYSHKEIQRLSK